MGASPVQQLYWLRNDVVAPLGVGSVDHKFYDNDDLSRLIGPAGMLVAVVLWWVVNLLRRVHSIWLRALGLVAILTPSWSAWCAP